MSERVKELNWGYLLSVIGLVFGIAWFVNSVILRLPIWSSVYAFSRGAVQATLVVSVASFLAFYTSLRPAGIRLTCLGLGPTRRVLQGLVAVLLFWVSVQLVVIISARINGLAFDFNPQLLPATQAPALGFWGLFLSQALGNALYEEVVFRGFLIPQFFLKCKKLLPTRVAPCVFLGAFLSLAIFVLYHLPNVISRRLPLTFLLYALVGGSLYT
jgi:membrane protease YdiL (CAAX protease family)